MQSVPGTWQSLGNLWALAWVILTGWVVVKKPSKVRPFLGQSLIQSLLRGQRSSQRTLCQVSRNLRFFRTRETTQNWTKIRSIMSTKLQEETKMLCPAVPSDFSFCPLSNNRAAIRSSPGRSCRWCSGPCLCAWGAGVEWVASCAPEVGVAFPPPAALGAPHLVGCARVCPLVVEAGSCHCSADSSSVAGCWGVWSRRLEEPAGGRSRGRNLIGRKTKWGQ